MGAPIRIDDDRDLRRARALARLLDTAVGIPGTPIRVGLDALLGLIPGAGDFAGAALSGYIVLAAVRRGAPPALVWRMLTNIGIDTLIGIVPVLGDIFDVGFKSNVRNVALLERYASEPATVVKSTRRLGVVVALALALVLVLIAAAGFFVARLLWQLLNN
jgi:uncharacterized protein DUF4112